MNLLLLNTIKSNLTYPKIITGKYGIRYLVFKKSALDFHILKNGIIGDWIAKYGHLVISHGDTIFDIGANVGLLTLPFSVEFAPMGRIYAFEPDPENIGQLYANIAINNCKNIQVMPIALQNKAKDRLQIFSIRRSIDGDGNENRGISTLENVRKHTRERISIPVSTIDNVVKRLKVKNVNLIKIDVEGSEYKVLQGGLHTIKSLKPRILYEFSPSIDKLINKNNSVHTYKLINNLGYSQYILIGENQVYKITNPATNLPDSNIICFPNKRVPSIIKQLASNKMI